ncbi:lipase secretion chaperone [Alteromonas sp. H39]|uniref:lipase secretion chaperone n=1 Tax=Alteromonas sp. H39 TaxID=3389876 RepID=UPI0039DFDC24
MRKLLLIGMPGVVLGILLYLVVVDENKDSAAVLPAEGSSTATFSSDPQPFSASQLPSANAEDSGQEFSLHYGLKAEFDLFIFEHEGESPTALTEAYTNAVVKRGFTADSQAYLEALFARYVQYKVELETLDGQAEAQDINAIASRLEARNDLRHTFFSADEYHYLFSKDAQYDDAALARLRIASDASLSDEEKQRLIETQLATLPADQQASFAPSLAVNRIDSLAKTYENPETRYQAIAAEFGHDVAQRMQEKAQVQSEWLARVKAFEQWKNDLVESGLTPEEASKLIADRRNRDFSETEQRRLRVFLENPALLGDE